MVKNRIGIFALLILLTAILLTILLPHNSLSTRMTSDSLPSHQPQSSAPSLSQDGLETKALANLKVFTDWLKVNQVKGYIGEVGWPDNEYGDSDKWNTLANTWYKAADAADLWVTNWSTGEWWGTKYALASYEKSSSSESVNSPNYQAQVIEQHLSTSSYLRGVNVSGGEFGVNEEFSNLNPGSYEYNYHYDSQATFNYLASRKVKLVRIPFRWERIQPNLGQALNEAELSRLKQVVNEANKAGLVVDLDMHNFGGYYLSQGDKVTRLSLGSSDLPDNLLADVWQRISQEFKNNPQVYYGLMNEPEGLQSVNNLSPAKVWEQASQTALKAIRANHDNKLIFVPGYNWSGVASWSQEHPKAWISDPANNFRYEAHQYFDHTGVGDYQNNYADELKWAVQEGYKSY